MHIKNYITRKDLEWSEYSPVINTKCMFGVRTRYVRTWLHFVLFIIKLNFPEYRIEYIEAKAYKLK